MIDLHSVAVAAGRGVLGVLRRDPAPGLQAWVLSAGFVTSVPLLLFAYGAQRIRLTTLGLLQYIAPTVQFLLGLFLYHEAFDAARLQAFALIWAGLAVYSADGFWTQRRSPLKSVGAG